MKEVFLSSIAQHAVLCHLFIGSLSCQYLMVYGVKVFGSIFSMTGVIYNTPLYYFNSHSNAFPPDTLPFDQHQQYKQTADALLFAWLRHHRQNATHIIYVRRYPWDSVKYHCQQWSQGVVQLLPTFKRHLHNHLWLPDDLVIKSPWQATRAIALLTILNKRKLRMFTVGD